MSSMRLSPGNRVEILGHVYEFLLRRDGKKKFLRVDTGAELWLSEHEIVKKLGLGELRLAPDPSIPDCRHEFLRKDFASMPEKVKQRAYRRREYADALIDNANRGCLRRPKDVVAEVATRREELPPSLSQAYEWARVWRLVNRRDIRYLVTAETKRGRRGPTGGKEEIDCIDQAIVELYATPQRHLVRTVHDRVVAVRTEAGGRYPSIRKIRRVIQSKSPYALLKARRGKRAADIEYAMAKKAEIAILPNEIWEIDAHRLDVIIVDDRTGFVLGRLWLTTAIDRCTRMVVGFHLHLEPPSSLTVAACLRNAIAPKIYVLNQWPDIDHEWPCWGVPVLVIADNGLENRAEFLKEAADEIGFHILWLKPDDPRGKAKIERWHLTLATDFSRRIPGATGSNPIDRGDYDAEGMAVATMADIDELLHRWVVPVYNRAFHRGINDIPERLYKELTEKWEVAPFSDVASLDTLFGALAWRTPSAKGIELLGLLYNSPVIELIRTRPGSAGLGQLKVRYDLSNLDTIDVLDPVTGRYETVPSTDPEYTRGLTAAQHRVIRKLAVQRANGYVSVQELCIARDRLQRRIEEILGNPHASGRMTAARLRGIGSKGSFGDFYRLSVDAYADGPIGDILDLEPTSVTISDAEPPKASAALPSPAVEPPKQPEDAPTEAEALQAKAARLGMKIGGTND